MLPRGVCVFCEYHMEEVICICLTESTPRGAAENALRFSLQVPTLSSAKQFIVFERLI